MKIPVIFGIICFIHYLITAQTTIKETSKTSSSKLRLVILTDVSTWETDDSESLARLLVHADLSGLHPA